MWKTIFSYGDSNKKPTNAEIEDKEEKVFKGGGRNIYSTTNPTLIIDCLFLGSELDARCSNVIQKHNIGYILNVADEVAVAQHEGVMSCKIRVEDLVHEHSHQHHTFELTFTLIDKAIAENKGILVHCARGRSRSATIIIGYLMTRKKVTLREAYDHVKKLRPIIGPHGGLQMQLMDFEKHLTDTNTMKMEDFYRSKYSPYG